MLAESLCTADFFVRPDAGRKEHQGLKLILGQFGLPSNAKSENLRFDIRGKSFQEVKENLVEAIAGYLDPSRKSCLMYFGDDGKLYTVIIQNGKVSCA